MVNIKQVHGDKIVVVNEGYIHEKKSIEEADAVVTDQKKVAIAVRTADCVPLFLYDSQNEIIGVVHAGWKGTEQNISGKTVALMKKIWGSDPAQIQVALGPSIRECCYEVGEEVVTEFRKAGFSAGIVRKKDGATFLDLKKANREMIEAEGIACIHDLTLCTSCRQDLFFSARRDAQGGRQVNFVQLRR